MPGDKVIILQMGEGEPAWGLSRVLTRFPHRTLLLGSPLSAPHPEAGRQEAQRRQSTSVKY